ncbi:MAG: hypothetical protein ACUVXI_16715 [bacterium]
MNIRTLRYYKIPHPLEPGKEIAVGDGEAISRTIREVYEFYENPLSDPPRVFRVLISPDRIDEGEAEGLVEEFERNFRSHLVEGFNRLKLREFLRFAKGLAIGYILYMIPQAFWVPLETFAESIGEGLGTYAKWWIIGFFPLRALIRSFGTGIHFSLPEFITRNPVYRRIPIVGKIQNIGTRGRWNEIERSSQCAQICDRFGKSQRERFSRDADRALRNVERKIGWERTSFPKRLLHSLSFGLYRPSLRHPLVDDLRGLVRDLIEGSQAPRWGDVASVRAWSERFDSVLERATEESRNGGKFPWGEIPKLARMKEDLIFHALNDGFAFAPLKVVHPGSHPNEVFGGVHFPLRDGGMDRDGRIDLALEIRAEALQKQAESLREFLRDPRIVRTQEGIYRDYESLGTATTREERIELLDRIASGFEKMRNAVGGYHMGENSAIPHEKGRDLSNFYHRLYLTFGRASCDLENRYKKVAFGVRPVLTGFGQRKRIREAEDEADILICRGRRRRMRELGEKLASGLGRTWRTGLATALCLVFLLGSALSFYTLGPGEVGIEYGYRLGYQKKFFAETVRTTQYGTGWRIPGVERDLHWHLPPPIFKGHRVSLERDQEFTVYMITAQHYPETLWEKVRSKLSGQLGLTFDAVKFTIGYVPKDAEVWANYDPDGLGPKRLIRDTVDIIDEWKTEKLADFQKGITAASDADEISYVFDTFFKELSRKGIIEDYIRNAFSRTALSSNIYYGSTLDRIKPGIDIVLNELDRRQEEYRSDLLISDPEREGLQKSLDSARQIVQETLSRIEKQVRVEYGNLRRHPLQLKEYVRNPYAHISELQNFEALWSGIQNYTWYLYNNEKALKILREGEKTLQAAFSNDGGNPLAADLIEKLRENDHINSLIDIKWVKYEISTIGLTQLNILQQKWQDII